MRISRKKFRTFFAIFVSRPTTRPGSPTSCKQGLSNDDDEGNENYVRKKRAFEAKQQLCTCITLFCHFFAVTVHDYCVKMPHFAFCGGRKQATTNFSFSFLTWVRPSRNQLQENVAISPAAVCLVYSRWTTVVVIMNYLCGHWTTVTGVVIKLCGQ